MNLVARHLHFSARNGWSACLLPALVVFALYQPAQVHVMADTGDSPCYLSYLGKTTNTPSLGNVDPCFNPPGVSLFWTPFAYLAKAVATLFGENPRQAMISIVGMSSALAWVGAFLLIARVLANASIPLFWLWTLGILSMKYILHHSFQSIAYPHALEAFLVSLFVYLVSQRRYWPSLVVVAAATVVRYNDAFLMLILIGAITDDYIQNRNRAPIPRALLLAVGGGLAAICVVFIPLFFFFGYGGVTKVHKVLMEFSLKWFFISVFGSQGFAWTNAWLLPVVGLGLFQFRTLSWRARAALFSFFFQLAICVGWHPFVYLNPRYMIGTLVALTLVVLDLRLGKLAKKVTAVCLVSTIVANLCLFLHFSPTLVFVNLVHLDTHALRQALAPVGMVGASPLPVLLAHLFGVTSILPGVFTPISFELNRSATFLLGVFVVLNVALLFWAAQNRWTFGTWRRPLKPIRH